MLPEFQFHSVKLHLDRDAHHQELYRSIQHTQHHNRRLGTRIWWGVSHHGEARCVKEFFRADPAQYQRQLPDPIWRKMPPPLEHTGSDRGLRGQRAQSFNERTHVSLDTETLRAIGQDSLFRDHFNAYAFELDALLTQFAQHYGYRQIVQAMRWGPVVMEDSLGLRNIIEMEKLQPLAPPHAGDYISVVHRVVEMMSAVTQLHAMAIPVRCYPPELVRDLALARQHPITRSFHFDLSPDQFLLRPATHDSHEEVVLIDFNSSRMAHTEYNNFFWYAIPGKDYFQPPERRRLHDYRNTQNTFHSSPIYDLYALLSIALFYLMRQEDSQTHPSHLPGWTPASQWQTWLQSSELLAHLQHHIASDRGVDPSPILKLIAATLPHPPLQRREALMSLDWMNWNGLQDWMLVPKAMNAIARKSLGRTLQVRWATSQVDLVEGEATVPIHSLLHRNQCVGQPGNTEQGRIDHPPFQINQLYFIQGGDSYPVVRNKQIEPAQAGQYRIYAVWRGCVDFANPLYINVQPYHSIAVSMHDSHTHTPPPTSEPTTNNMKPIQDATLVEMPAPVFSAPEIQPASPWERAPAQAEELTSDAFWKTPPPQPAPPSLTAHYTREKHTPPPTVQPAPPNPYAGQLPSASIVQEHLSIPAILSDNTPPPSQRPSTSVWLQRIALCSQNQDLDRYESDIALHFEKVPMELTVQIHTRRCELALLEGDLSLGWPSLNAMVHLLRRESISKFHTGTLLNNLTVYCYMWAWQEKNLPVWSTQVGLDPLSHLKHWMQLSNLPEPTAPQQMKALRRRSRETIACAQHIQRALQKP